jgi:SAM-dependent methyltransferase
MNNVDIKEVVRKGYAEIAKRGDACCSPVSSCCDKPYKIKDISKNIGYSDNEIASAPEGANLGLGCGNPVALASIKSGQTVLDLGSGAGFDAFLAANRVGKYGRVIGIDMTPEMITKARTNAVKGGYQNVEFRLGEIENIPLVDNYIDVIISNCVINLSLDKKRVFQEVFRVLKSGGSFMVSDIVLLEDLPSFIKESVVAYVGCISGAMLKRDYLTAIKQVGFKDIKILKETLFPIDCIINDPNAKVVIDKLKLIQGDINNFSSSIISIKLRARKL